MPEQKDVETLWAEHRKTTQKIDRILSYLETDPTTGRKGIVMEIQDLKQDNVRIEEKIDSFISLSDTEKKVRAAKVGIISAVVAALVAGLGTILKLIFGHG